MIPLHRSQLDDEVQEFFDRVIERGTTDLDFRTRLLENPAQAIADDLGVDIPANKVRFVESDGADLVLGLPTPVVNTELSEEELEVVAGGEASSCSLWWIISIKAGGGDPPPDE